MQTWTSEGQRVEHYRGKSYVSAPEYDADGYRVSGWDGVAFAVYGWEVEPDEDTEWSGIEQPTGALVVCMVGDDRLWTVDPGEVTALSGDEFCSECGQIGCGC